MRWETYRRQGIAALQVCLKMNEAVVSRWRGLGVLILLAVSSIVCLVDWFSSPETAVSRFALWAIATGLLVVRLGPSSEPVGLCPAPRTGWLLLGLGLGAAVWYAGAGGSNALLSRVALWFLVLSGLAMMGGERVCREAALPLAVLWMAVPLLPSLVPWISLPLRQVSAQMAGALLGALGSGVSVRGTEIAIGEERIAITAACGGIVLLEAMIWMAWLFVLTWHRKPWTRLLHFTFLVPLVILGNGMRIVLLILAFQRKGMEALTGPAHLNLGYLMVGITAVLYFALEYLLGARPGEAAA